MSFVKGLIHRYSNLGFEYLWFIIPSPYLGESISEFHCMYSQTSPIHTTAPDEIMDKVGNRIIEGAVV